MKIVTALVDRDSSGGIVSESPVAKHAIVTDEKSGLAEVLTSDAVDIEGLTYLKSDGIFQIQLALGGYDSAGVFHRNLKYPNALISIVKGRENDDKFWAEHRIDELLAPLLDDLKPRLHKGNAIDTIAQAVWNLPKLESQLLDDKGKVVNDYKRGSKKATPAPGPLEPEKGKK